MHWKKHFRKIILYYYLLILLLVNIPLMTTGYTENGSLTENLGSDGEYLYMNLEDGVVPYCSYDTSMCTIATNSNSEISDVYSLNITRDTSKENNDLLNIYIPLQDNYYHYTNGIMPNNYSFKFKVKSYSGNVNKIGINLYSDRESPDMAFAQIYFYIQISNLSFYIQATTGDKYYFTPMTLTTNTIYTIRYSNIDYNPVNTGSDSSCNITLSDGSTTQTINNFFFGPSGGAYIGKIFPFSRLHITSGNDIPNTLILHLDDWTSGTNCNVTTGTATPTANSATITGYINNDGSTLQNLSQTNLTVKIVYDTVSDPRPYTFEKTITGNYTGENVGDTITGLTPGETYYYRLYAETNYTNSSSYSYGEEYSFIAVGIPEITTNYVCCIYDTDAELHMIVNNNGSCYDYCGYSCRGATHYFQYGYTTDYGSTTVPIFYDGPTPYGFSTHIDTGGSITPGHIYHFRACGDNCIGTGYGSDKSFLTKPSNPSNLIVSNYGESEQYLSWTLGTGSEKTIIRGQQNSYPSSPTDGEEIYNNTNNYHVTTDKNGDWYYRAWGFVDDSGYSQVSTGYSEYHLMAVRTPITQTNSSTGIKNTNVTLNGNVSDKGGYNCSLYFQYNSGYGSGYSTTVDATNSSTIIRPNGAGVSTTISSSTGGTHWGEVDDTTYDTDTYVYTTSGPSDQNDTYTMTDMYTITGTEPNITSITVYYTVRNSEPSNPDIAYQPIIYTNSKYYFGAEEWSNFINQSWNTFHYTWTQNPDTGKDWTRTEINNLQVGIRIYTTASHYGKCTQIYAIIDYKHNDSFEYNLTSLTPGTYYRYRTKASNYMLTGYGLQKTFLTKPNPPTNLNLLVGDSTIGLNWVLGTGANTTHIQRKTTGYPTSITDGTTIFNSSGTSTNDDTVTNATLYYYSAWSHIESYGLNQFSDTYATVVDITRPDDPMNTHYNVTGNKLVLDWVRPVNSNGTIIVQNNISTPTSPTDGYIVYNGTGQTVSITPIVGITNYFRAYSFANWTNPNALRYSYNGTPFIIQALFINCYDETNGSNLTFNVTIVNKEGTQTYNASNCVNTKIIPADELPQGDDVTIIVSARYHNQRTYYLDINTNLFYFLNATLPYTPTENAPEGSNESKLYTCQVISEIGETLGNVKVSIYGLVNNTDYELLEIKYSSGNGQFSIWLLPGKLYKINLSLEGGIYQTTTVDYIPQPPDIYGVTIGGIFKMYFISETPIYQIPIIFTATRTGTTITVYYYDEMINTTNTTILVYELDSYGNETLYTTITNTTENRVYYNISGVNNLTDYRIVLFYTHSFFGSQKMSIGINRDYTGLTYPTKIDSMLTVIIGQAGPFLWSNLIFFLFFVAMMFVTDKKDSGKYMILLGGIFVFIAIIGFNTTLLQIANGIIPGLFVTVGVILEWVNHKRGK